MLATAESAVVAAMRQTQQPSIGAQGGRVITDTQYDGRGLISQSSAFWNSAAPTDVLAGFSNADVATQHRYTYDYLERSTADALWSANTMQWQTAAVYQGDRTAIIAPTGGITSQALFDARGNITELRQYASTNLSGSFTQTNYTYDRLGELTGVTVPSQ